MGQGLISASTGKSGESVQWSLVDSLTPQHTSATLPEKFNELCVVYKTGLVGVTMVIPRQALTAEARSFRMSSVNVLAQNWDEFYAIIAFFDASLTSISVTRAIIVNGSGGINSAPEYSAEVYAR